MEYGHPVSGQAESEQGIGSDTAGVSGAAGSATSVTPVARSEASPQADAGRPPWWWRRRPPVGHTRFARAVWWAGHVQLPMAFVLLVVCLPTFIGSAAPGATFGGYAWLGLAMAWPFAVSGVMLRASSEWRLYWPPPLGGGPVKRTIGLGMTVTGIAILSIVLTVVVAYVLLFVGQGIAAAST